MSAGIVPDAAGMNKGFGISSSARTSRSLEETHPPRLFSRLFGNRESRIAKIDRYHFTFPLTVNVIGESCLAKVQGKILILLVFLKRDLAMELFVVL